MSLMDELPVTDENQKVGSSEFLQGAFTLSLDRRPLTEWNGY
jgi:hypothetical protein